MEYKESEDPNIRKQSPKHRESIALTKGKL